MEEELIKKLEVLNFNKIEAKVYIELVKSNQLNGSQIAKKINASRSSVYLALDNLYKRGCVYLISGDTNMYTAEKPDILIEKMKLNFEESANTIKDELLKLEQSDSQKNYYNLSGTQNFINKVKELLLYAEKEVYINTCIDLQIFKSEFDILNKRGVRIIVFTYKHMNVDNLSVELYYHSIEDYNEDENEEDEIRLMMVVDLNNTLICSANNANEEMTGTFTENKFLANIVSEHIHHDIYLLRLKDREGKELIDNDILIGSLLEKRMENKTPLKYKEKY